MHIQKQLIRQYIFVLFAILILWISCVLVYHITLSEETGNEKTNSQNEKDICTNNTSNVFIYISFCYKLIGAFFAGSIISDKTFLKFGVI